MPETKLPAESTRHGEERGNTALLEKPSPTEKPTEVSAEPTPAGPEAKKSALSPGKVIAGLVVLCLLAAGGIWGWRAWSFGKTHVSTDDAFVSGNLVNVSPTISGTLSEL